jgi:hypothetical protein
MTSNIEKFIGCVELGSILGLSATQVRALANRKQIPSYKFSNEHYFRLTEVLEALEEMKAEVESARFSTKSAAPSQSMKMNEVA